MQGSCICGQVNTGMTDLNRKQQQTSGRGKVMPSPATFDYRLVSRNKPKKQLQNVLL